MRAARPLRVMCAPLLAASFACLGQQPTSATDLPPSSLEPNVIRSWGDDAMSGLMLVWEKAYRRRHPEISFKDSLRGSATGMAGITTNSSDLALMGRPVTVNEVIGFEWVHRTKPLGIQVANGNLKGEGASPALAVLVSNENPLSSISMAQLAAILGCPSEAYSEPAWALAGAQGAWANRPVHVYLYDDQTGTGAFLQQAVQGAKDCWNWDIVKEFKDVNRANGSKYPAGRQIADALRNDPGGLAITTLEYAIPGTKPLALSSDGAPVQETQNSVIAATYPLARGVYIYINHPASKPVDPKIAQFLRFILSPEGQALVQRQGNFLPLNPASVKEQKKKLE